MHRTIIRYFLIINRVRRPGFPSFEEIGEMLKEHDFDIAARTLQRDINYIRTEFGIEIKYDVYQNGYFLDHENSPGLDSLMKFLEMAVLTGNFKELYRDTKEVRRFLSFDSEGVVKGVEYISKILFSLKNRQHAVINYQRFTDEEPYLVEIKPQLLKEYQNRWYLVGLIARSNELRAYALDRMHGIKLLEKTYKASEAENIKERFSHVIGISQSDKKPATIKLTFNIDQAKYIETLPWHPSQEVVHRDERIAVFELFVVPNYELEQKILAEGNNIRKIEPDWLAEQISIRR